MIRSMFPRWGWRLGVGGGIFFTYDRAAVGGCFLCPHSSVVNCVYQERCTLIGIGPRGRRTFHFSTYQRRKRKWTQGQKVTRISRLSFMGAACKLRVIWVRWSSGKSLLLSLGSPAAVVHTRIVNNHTYMSAVWWPLLCASWKKKNTCYVGLIAPSSET